MKKTISGQPLANTRVDSQGEQLTPDDLCAILQGMGQRSPLNQHHDMSLPFCGEMTNFRIVKDQKDSSLMTLVCDVTIDDEIADRNTGGFSFSVPRILKMNSTDSEFEVFFPYPLYNDQVLLDSFLSLDFKVGVGKWVKKEISPALIAMVVVIVSPVWTSVYKVLLKEKVERFLRSIKGLWPKEVGLQINTQVPTKKYEPQPSLVIVSPDAIGIDCLSTITDALDSAKEFCEAGFSQFGKRIRRIRMKLDMPSGRYFVLGVEYIDGSNRSFS